MLSTRSLELLDYISFAILSLLQPYTAKPEMEIGIFGVNVDPKYNKKSTVLDPTLHYPHPPQY